MNHGAPERLLLAYRYSGDGNQLRELIARGKITKLTDRTLVDPRRLEDELKKIRRSGYATSDCEAIRGAVGIAVPVWNSTGQVEAALALTVLKPMQ